MENESISPEQQIVPSILATPSTRHDGWSGEKMAIFCDTLADTGIVVDACAAADKSTNTAYALRRRNPFFAAAWDAALTIARERLADTLLARSIEGNIEQIWRDGELVGERRVIDNRLGLAILRRLDRLSAGEMPGASRTANAAPAPQSAPVDWEMMVDALRTGDPDAIATSLAHLKGHETHETHDPSNSPIEDEEDAGIDLSERCWKDELDGIWTTDFPPPEGFEGYQSRSYGEDVAEHYERACTPEEIAILESDAAANAATQLAEDEQLRDAWFDFLKAEAPGEIKRTARPEATAPDS